LGWKHGFVQARAIPVDLLVIGVVRRADDWLRSMHTKPWHCSSALQSLEFSDFIRAEWDTIIDRPRYFEGAQDAGEVGQPRRDCAFILLRMEDVIAAPEQTLARIANALSPTIMNDSYRPVVKRLGAKFKPNVPNRPATPATLPEADRDWLRHAIDGAQERHLGYAY